MLENCVPFRAPHYQIKGNWREFRDIKNDEEAIGINLQAKILKN